MLIAKTLRSWTSKAALIWIAGFGAPVIAPSIVYSSTASYVPNRSDRAVDAERAILAAAYRNELIATIISGIETTSRTSGFGAVDLVEVSEAVADLYDAAAAKYGELALIGEKPIMITGDRDLLFDAGPHLVDNANTAAMPGRSPSGSAEARTMR